MEKFKSITEQHSVQHYETLLERKQLIMEDFYKRYFEPFETGAIRIITLADLKELKKAEITTEEFLDYICQKHRLLLHGSIKEISGSKLKPSPESGTVFASNKAVVAIMRSLYSNIGVSLEYPYKIKKHFVLKIHTQPDGKFIHTDRGFVYVVRSLGFRNKPKNSWQFINEDIGGVEVLAVVETEVSDFKYPVEIYNDYKPKKKYL